MKLYYDFHIHSCLSPCGDADNTPNNIVNMALVKGLHVIALSDHNTGKNCPAAIAVGKKNGLIVLPAMELTTSEDIHILCLFEKYEDLQKLEGELLSALKGRMLKGVTLKPGEGFDGGFRIAEKDGGVYYDFSSEAVVEMLSNYLNPSITALLKEAE